MENQEPSNVAVVFRREVPENSDKWELYGEWDAETAQSIKDELRDVLPEHAEVRAIPTVDVGFLLKYLNGSTEDEGGVCDL